MKINEVEQLLGISKANIRFYEKQNLLAPRRSENGYRDYSDEDVHRLQDIVILRKLGIPVQEIGKIFCGELSLQEAIRANIAQLEDQIEQLNGALQLSRQIEREDLNELDTQRYWDTIQQQESAGMKFVEIMRDYWSNVLKPTMVGYLPLNEKATTKKILLLFLALCLIRGISGAVRDGSFWSDFLYFPMILLFVILITLPVFLLGQKHPKAASCIWSIISWLIIAFFVLLFLVIIIGLIIGLTK